MDILVLDLSKYQRNVDYKKVAKNVGGVIIRCGLTYWGAQNKAADECFEMHYKGFKEAGVPIGVYYYSAADSVNEAKLEASKCLDIIRDKTFEFPIYFDMENPERQGNLGSKARYEIADAFLSTVQAAGYFVGFYSYSSFISQMGTYYFGKLKKQYSIWLADYRANPAKYTRDMWQYTSTGRIDGIDGNVDLSHCYKDFPSIIQKAGLNGYSKVATNKTEAVDNTIKVGDTVSVKRAIQYDNGRPFKVYYKTYKVEQVNGKRAVISKLGIVVAAVDVDNLKKV